MNLDLDLEKIYSSIRNVNFHSDYNRALGSLDYERSKDYCKDFENLDSFLLYVINNFDINCENFKLIFRPDMHGIKYMIILYVTITSKYGNNIQHIITYEIQDVDRKEFEYNYNEHEKLIQSSINSKLRIFKRYETIDKLLDI